MKQMKWMDSQQFIVTIIIDWTAMVDESFEELLMTRLQCYRQSIALCITYVIKNILTRLLALTFQRTCTHNFSIKPN